MCCYRGTERLLLSIKTACSCDSVIGKEQREKQHDDVVVFVASGVVCGFVVCGGREGREERRRGAERGKRRVEFSGGADFSYTSHPLFTLVYLPHLQNPSLSLR